jgi:hypothetical protein
MTHGFDRTHLFVSGSINSPGLRLPDHFTSVFIVAKPHELGVPEMVGSRVKLYLFIEHSPRSSRSRIPFTRCLAASLKLWHAKNTPVNRESVSSTRKAANVRFH